MTDHFRAMKFLAEHLSEEQLQSAADCRLTTVRFGQALKAIDDAFQAAFDLGFKAAGGEILPLPFLNVSPPIQYASAAVEAVQRLLERGKATVDSEGYLQAIEPAPSRTPQEDVLRQARHFIAIIITQGPKLIQQHRWESLYETALEMDKRLTTVIDPAAQETPTRQRQDRNGLGPKDGGSVGNADAPNINPLPHDRKDSKKGVSRG